jgi:hypothetical protein
VFYSLSRHDPGRPRPRVQVGRTGGPFAGGAGRAGSAVGVGRRDDPLARRPQVVEAVRDRRGDEFAVRPASLAVDQQTRFEQVGVENGARPQYVIGWGVATNVDTQYPYTYVDVEYTGDRVENGRNYLSRARRSGSSPAAGRTRSRTLGFPGSEPPADRLPRLQAVAPRHAGGSCH